MEKKKMKDAPPQENETPFQRFRRLASRVVSAPKVETDKLEQEQKQEANKNG